MTRLEMIRRISDLFRGKYRLDTQGRDELAWVTLVKPGEGCQGRVLFKWFGMYSFLFGLCSIFDTVRVYRAAARDPNNRQTTGDTPEDRDIDEFVSEFGWLGDLSGCSSVEELELKMAVLGKL